MITRFPLLSRQQRSALTALHAYAQELTDVVNQCSEHHVAMTALNWWQEQIPMLYQAAKVEISHPVLRLLQPAIEQFELPQAELMTVIKGKSQALMQDRYADLAKLEQFIQPNSYLFGRLTSRILGISSEQTLEYADAAGRLCLMSLLISSVGTDACKSLIYLPVSELEKFNITEDMILNHTGGQMFEQYIAVITQQLRQQFRKTVQLLPHADKKRQKASVAQLACYYALLSEISQDGVANILRYQLALPRPRQFRIALKTGLFGFHP